MCYKNEFLIKIRHNKTSPTTMSQITKMTELEKEIERQKEKLCRYFTHLCHTEHELEETKKELEETKKELEETKIPCNECGREVWVAEDLGYGCKCFKCQDKDNKTSPTTMSLPQELINMILYKFGGMEHPVAKIFKEELDLDYEEVEVFLDDTFLSIPLRKKCHGCDNTGLTKGDEGNVVMNSDGHIIECWMCRL